MRRRLELITTISAAFALAGILDAWSTGSSADGPASRMRFVENLGQWPASVRYLAEGEGARVRAECNAIGIEIHRSEGGGTFVRLAFEGASSGSDLGGEVLLPGVHSYFFGQDPAQWRGGAHGFARVRWKELWPGVDLVLYQGEHALEYDLEVAPGADLASVALRLEGADPALLVDAEGTAVAGELESLLHVPKRCYQLRADGTSLELGCRWRLDERGCLRVEVPDRDPTIALVIDPELYWSTYLGGPSHEGARAVVWDTQGGVTVAGPTTDIGFPQTPGAFQAPTSSVNAFLTRFSATGQLRYSSIFGPISVVGDVAVAPNGEATVVGETESSTFPVTPGAYDTVKNSYRAAFVTQLASTGTSLVYSTFLEGQQLVQIRVVLDSQGRAVVGGAGDVTGFPVTPGTVVASPAADPYNSFLTKLSASGGRLVWSMLLGGDRSEGISDIVVGARDEVTLVGSTTSTDFPTTLGAIKTSLGPANQNCFVSRLDADATALLWSTYLGGWTLGGEDYAEGLALTDDGDAIVVGRTNSPTFPVTPGAFQTQYQFQGPSLGFVSRVRNGGQALVASTFLVDPNGWSGCRAVAADPSGVLTVSGGGTPGFPLTPGCFQTQCHDSTESVIVRLSPALDRLFYSSFLGGYGQDAASYMAMTPTGRVAMVGQSWSSVWPVTQNAYQPFYGGGANDAVVAVLDLVLEGIRLAGHSLPSCKGPLQANASEMPQAGSQTFSLWCSAAPPGSNGYLSLGYGSQHVAAPGGLPGLLPTSLLLPVTSDASGFVETVLPLPPASAGSVFAARFLFPATGTCSGSGLVAASNVVIVTVQ